MKTKSSGLVAPLLVLLLLFSCSEKTQKLSFTRESPFNSGWKFVRGDVADAQSLGFDDSSWRELTLPHDWSIEDLPAKEGVKQIGPFSEESVGGSATGFSVGGVGWYRKHFKISESDKDKLIHILFDGIYMDATVWLNGHHLGTHPYGYTAFAYNLTPFLNPPGQDNVVAVRVANEGKNSRWYSGSGIYRDVTLIKTNPEYIDLWGNYITTPQVSEKEALVKIDTKTVNHKKERDQVEVAVSIYSPEGKLVGETEKQITLNAGDSTIVSQQIKVKNPELWSLESPQLYTAVTGVENKGELVDQVRSTFGIRSISFSAEKGFLLNGKEVLLKGGCLHHTNGPLGAAAFKTAEYRRVRLMKEDGFNAIRTSHNPPSAFFLDACDKLGVLVLDEAFDQWERPKNPQDYSLYFDNWWERDIESMVKRDRNHPSVIIWSIGNEINERADSSGLVIARMLKNRVKELDNTRPVTQAICEFWDHPGRPWDATAPAFAQMDIQGYNYQWARYESDHQKYPDRIMVGTESTALEVFDNWRMVEKHPYVIGDFVWTGVDYLGESGIGNAHPDNVKWGFMPPWPWFNSYCGDISILGYKKPQIFYREVVWGNSNLEMEVHVPIPAGHKEVVSYWGWPEEWKSWNWEGNEGKLLTVAVFSNADSVRLELNGKVVGEEEASS